jgi:hypothetical protein
MNMLLFFPYYVRWHYGQGTKDLFVILGRFVSFVFSFFSITLLFQTLFSPWKRLRSEYQKGFHPEEFFSSLLINTIMRIVGLLIRTVVIFLGLIATILMMTISLAIALIWIFYPLVLAFLIVLFFENIF